MPDRDDRSNKLAVVLLSEAQRMYQSLLTEVTSERWSGCQGHVLSFNTLLNRSCNLRLSDDITPMRPLSDREIGTEGCPSSRERETIIETMKRSLSLSNALENFLSLPAFPIEESDKNAMAIARVKTICDRFHVVALSLQKSYQTRTGFHINDEYDVQHLIRALMFLDFDEVTKEVYVPIYAGKQGRMDFVMEQHGIVLETKMTRRDLKDGKIGDELLLDIARYQTYPNVNYLVCFVYDPENLIENPSKMIRDLQAKSMENFQVIVSVRPKRF